MLSSSTSSLPFLSSLWPFFILLFYFFLFLFQRSAYGDAGRNDDNWNKHKLLEGSSSFCMVILTRPERSPPTPRPLSLPHLFRSSSISRYAAIQIEDRILISRVVRNGIRVFIMRKRILSYSHCTTPSSIYGWKKVELKYSNQRGVALWHYALFKLWSWKLKNCHDKF